MNPNIPLWTILLACTLAGMRQHAVASEPAPQPTELSRYEAIWKKSPFVAVTDLSGQADDLAGRFVLTGFARMGEQDVVFLFDRTSLDRFKLTPGETRQGIALQSLQHRGDLKSVRATIASGGRTLDLTYDPAQQPDGGQPNQAGMPVVQGQPGHPTRVYPGQPQPPGQQPRPGNVITGQQAQQGMQQNNPNQIVGGTPATAEPPPPPRRVIRRRAIVAPE